MKNDKMSKILAMVMASVMCVSLMSISVFADSKTGVGQTEAKIHLDQNLGNGSVTVRVGEKTYTGKSQGKQITIEMDSTDNGFDIGRDETIEIEFQTADSKGSIEVAHQEGNGTNIANEHDKGLNNYSGKVTIEQPAAEEEIEEEVEEEVEEKTEEQTEEPTEEQTEELIEEEVEEEIEEEVEEKTEEKTEEQTEEQTEELTEEEVEEEIEEEVEEKTEEKTEESRTERKHHRKPAVEVKEEIEDEIIPMSVAAEEEIEAEIIPEAEAPVEVEEIFDEAIPLAEVPQTSDSAMLWAVLMLLSGTAAAGLSFSKRKVNG